jgi:prophage regulatory protein
MRKLEKPTKLLKYGELNSTRGISFSRRHLYTLEEKNNFPKRVALGVNRIGWVETEIDEWLATKLAARNI